MNELLHLAANNPDIVSFEDGKDSPIGKQMIPELPPRDSRYTDNTRATILKIVTDSSPKVASMLRATLDCIKREEKFSVWTSFPGTQYLVYLTLLMANVPAKQFDSHLDRSGRDAMVDEFNSIGSSGAKAIVFTYVLGGQGLNLQFGSHIIFQFDPPSNTAQDQQCVGRSFRIGQTWHVFVFRFFILNGHDDWVNKRAFKLAIPEIRASIDAETLFTLTKARVPKDVDEQQWKEQLRNNLSGFFINRDVPIGECLRHVSSFDPPKLSVEAQTAMETKMAELERDLEEADKPGSTKQLTDADREEILIHRFLGITP